MLDAGVDHDAQYSLVGPEVLADVERAHIEALAEVERAQLAIEGRQLLVESQVDGLRELVLYGGMAVLATCVVLMAAVVLGWLRRRANTKQIQALTGLVTKLSEQADARELRQLAAAETFTSSLATLSDSLTSDTVALRSAIGDIEAMGDRARVNLELAVVKLDKQLTALLAGIQTVSRGKSLASG